MSANLVQLGIDRLDITWQTLNLESLGTHSPGKATVENNQEPARLDACTPLAEHRKRDRRCREIIGICIMGDQLMRLRAVSGKGNASALARIYPSLLARNDPGILN